MQFKLQYTEALNAGLTFDLLSHQLWFAAECNCTCLENPGNKLAIEENVLCAPFQSLHTDSKRIKHTDGL